MLRPRVNVVDGQINIPALSWWTRWLDWLLRPLMYWLQYDWRSLPQETHRWNNARIERSKLAWLDSAKCIDVLGDTSAAPRLHWRFVPHSHLPCFGGWQRYVVLRPTGCGPRVWYVGWATEEFGGLSLLPLVGPVRVLRGPSDVVFFGVDADGRQIHLKKIGDGKLGSRYYRDIPLR